MRAFYTFKIRFENTIDHINQLKALQSFLLHNKMEIHWDLQYSRRFTFHLLHVSTARQKSNF